MFTLLYSHCFHTSASLLFLSWWPPASFNTVFLFSLHCPPTPSNQHSALSSIQYIYTYIQWHYTVFIFLGLACFSLYDILKDNQKLLILKTFCSNSVRLKLLTQESIVFLILFKSIFECQLDNQQVKFSFCFYFSYKSEFQVWDCGWIAVQSWGPELRSTVATQKSGYDARCPGTRAEQWIPGFTGRSV